MNFGDFEDVDVDQEQGEASRWDFGSSTMVALQNPCRGTAALCLQRSSGNMSDAVAAFRNRVRVMGDPYNTPNKDVSLCGYVRGEGAGPLKIVSRYYASEGAAEFGEELAFDCPGGTFAWQPFTHDLHMPPDDPERPGDPPAVNARAVRIFLRHSPPASGAGHAWFDEIAMVNWEETLDPLTGPVLATPHARDFLRVQGPAGTYRLALTFRSYRPTEADVGHGPHCVLETECPDQSADRLWFRPTSVGFEDRAQLRVRNLGNENLVVSNLSLLGSHATDFLARWVTANGSSAPGVPLSIPPQGFAWLEVLFAPTSAGSREGLLEFQTNDPDAGQSLARVVVGGEAYVGTPVRRISGNRSLSPHVHVQIPTTVSPTNLLWEQLPAGLTPVNISHGGQWVAASRTLQWGNVGGGLTVRYSLVGTSNACAITGWIAGAGQVEPTAGDTEAVLCEPPDTDADELPDWWEQKFFDSRTAAVPEMDSDGDGQINLSEMLNETHPLDGGFQAQPWAPYLRLSVDHHFAHLEVLGFEGTSYQVESSTNLQEWQPVSGNVLSGQTLIMPRTNFPAANSLFYRVLVETQ
jgi:hypothetical protein